MVLKDLAGSLSLPAANSVVAKGKADNILFEKYSRKEFNGRDTYRNEVQFDLPLNGSAERVGNVTSGLAPYTGAWTIKEALHLLKRTGYGFKKSHADTISLLTMSQAVDLILNVSSTPPSAPVNWYQSMQADFGNVPYGNDWTNNALDDYGSQAAVNTNLYRAETVKIWMTGLALNQDITIREKMTAFWYHFIPVDFNTVLDSNNIYCATNSGRICYKYMKLFRDFATGNYKTLITQMATHPAMMYYLNNQANLNIAPDENFAREIMELFTLGKGPESQYTQNDVIAAAKVLTGWRVQNLNTSSESTVFFPEYHDYSSKQFSSFFNNTIISGTGASELTAFIDMIFSKSKIVSEYICRRLYRYFVYYDIDANVEANVIVPLAQLFVSSNWEIKPVLSALFKSQHFYDMANRGVYIKSPFDLIIGTARTFNLATNVPDQTNYFHQYWTWYFINNAALKPSNQIMGEMPNVSGWPAFYQVPKFHQFWINSITIQQRTYMMTYMLWGFNVTTTTNVVTTRIEINEIAFVQQFPNATIRNPDTLINECVKYLLPIDISTEEKNKIKFDTLFNGQATNYWTPIWDAYILNPGNTNNTNSLKYLLKRMIGTLIELPEYQLM